MKKNSLDIFLNNMEELEVLKINDLSNNYSTQWLGLAPKNPQTQQEIEAERKEKKYQILIRKKEESKVSIN